MFLAIYTTYNKDQHVGAGKTVVMAYKNLCEIIDVEDPEKTVTFFQAELVNCQVQVVEKTEFVYF